MSALLVHSGSRRAGFLSLASVCAVLSAALVNPAPATSPSAIAPACTLSASGVDIALTRTRQQLTHGTALTIVAIGSSSTEGAGASSGSASYPSRLEEMLKRRFPAVEIRVLNRGVGGEEEADMLARFDRDVIAEKPDLVLWQVGSNAVMRDRALSTQEALIRTGIARLRKTEADIVLVDPQYTNAILQRAVAVPMVELIGAEARRQGVGRFRRFALMKAWREKESIPFEAFSIADGLHMNDWGYDCLARNLAAAIVDAAVPSVASSAR
jgi:lysophospholipase L1-like esterase